MDLSSSIPIVDAAPAVVVPNNANANAENAVNPAPGVAAMVGVEPNAGGMGGLFGEPPHDDYGDEDDHEFAEESQETNAPKRELTEDEKYVQEVRKKWRKMTDAQLRETMMKPLGAAELVREATRMHEEQLQIIAPYMTDDQITTCIPSLQLQQQGALVQGFSAPQIRQCVRVIPQGDRQLLLQNITLITASETDPSKDDEIQGLIGFIDPLAMGAFLGLPIFYLLGLPISSTLHFLKS